jgi:hypothetical protein
MGWCAPVSALCRSLHLVPFFLCGFFDSNNNIRRSGTVIKFPSASPVVAGKVGSVDWCDEHRSGGSMEADIHLHVLVVTGHPPAGVLIKCTVSKAFQDILSHATSPLNCMSHVEGSQSLNPDENGFHTELANLLKIASGSSNFLNEKRPVLSFCSHDW